MVWCLIFFFLVGFLLGILGWMVGFFLEIWRCLRLFSGLRKGFLDILSVFSV